MKFGLPKLVGNLPRRSLVAIGALIVILFILALGWGAVKTFLIDGKEKGSGAGAEWKPHLADYSQGWMPAEGIPRIRFSHPVITEEQIGKPLDGIIKLKPDHDVVAVFISTSELEIRHEKHFPSGKEFEVVLLPDRLMNLPDNLPDLLYRIKILEQSMNLREVGLVADPKITDGMLLEGELTITDTAAFNDIEKTITARQGDTPLTITWKHVDTLKHQFTIEGILRKETASQILIAWDGAAISVPIKGERTVDVPQVGVFAVTSIRSMAGTDSYIEVRFSEPLDGRQNLQGLVKLNGIDARSQVDGSVLRIYSREKLQGDQAVHLEAAIKSTQGQTLKAAVDETVAFITEMPGIRFAEKGHIMPPSDKLSIPVEAVAVNAIQIKAFEIYPDNIGQYLQSDGMGYKSNRGDYYDSDHNRVGRYLWQKKITLPKIPQTGWERFDLDVSELIANKKGSLMRIELDILPQFSTYPCATPITPIEEEPIERKNYDGTYRKSAIPERLQKYYQSAGYYEWSQRENPCHAAYYSEYQEHAHAIQTFFASNIGLLAKQGEDDAIHVLTTNLKNATPQDNVDVVVFNYQQQVIGTGKSNSDGLAIIHLEGVPFYVRAKKDGDTNYLKVPRNEALPINQFSTSGVKPEKGLKGFFYGERDIWRPGDDIFLTFILKDRDKTLPANYPLTLEFFDPRNGKVASITNTKPVNSFYTFTLKTPEDAPTGNWRAIVKVGDSYFDKVIRLENIAPNRLKIEMDLPADGLHLDDDYAFKTTLKAQWLTGATAVSLKADLQAKLSTMKTVFAGYEGYTFDDKARTFSQEPQKVFEGSLDANGKAAINASFDISEAPPGMLNVAFTQRVFEPGGQFSSQYRSVPLYPFSSWVGMHMPEGNKDYYGALDKDADHTIDLLALNSHGKPIGARKLEVTVHAIDWRWWWDDENEDFARYISNHSRALKETAMVTTDASGRAQWIFSGKKYDWGRHLVRVCDTEERGEKQHCSSQDIYLGWGYGEQGSRDAATRMSLSSDKENYRVGETASIHLPEGPDRKVFVSIENGSRILSHYWQDVKSGSNTFSLPITNEMTPNVYVHVTQLQAHQQRNNDLPIRLYGILPILVDDPATHLTPVLAVPAKVRPESKLVVKVSEQAGQEMTYTLAMVDEGLLGITDYKTPDPHDTFYKREALGVSTWDLFDLVVGAYGADLARLLAIGGSDALKKRENSRERRFPPIVRFLGPFKLAAKGNAEHTIDLPPYMGAVRVMVVAGNDKAFGRAEQSITVTKPLTLLSTLPRVLGPGEEVNLPVNVFVSEAPFGDATVSVEADDFFTVLKGEQKVNFAKAGENVVFLRLKVNDRIGMAKVTIKGQLGSEKVQEVIHIPVRSANVPSTRTEARMLKPGEEWTASLVPHGMMGTNTTTLMVSSLPELKLEERLRYLMEYPYGCIEQTTSAVFPQLYLPLLMELTPEQKQEAERNVNAAIERMVSFQTAGGGFAYWPYQNDVNPWSNNYAGHFLLEAKQLGYSVPANMLKNWLNYQREQTKSLYSDNYSGDAYRLYTLALAGQADTGAMNRLREKLKANPSGKTVLERWMLALAYQQIGQADIAKELLEQAGNTPEQSNAWGWTYGSSLRDQSVLLLLRYRLGQTDAAWQLATDMAADLSRDDWYSTQTTSWALSSIANTFGSKNQQTQFALRQGKGQWQNLSSVKSVYRQALTAYQQGQLGVRNTTDHPLYVAVANRGVPANSTELRASNGLTLEARFSNMKGEPINIQNLPMGQDFVAEVTVTNTSGKELDNLALTQVVPSGWQIRNSRLEGMSENSALDYMDIRDDRQVSFFSLSAAANSGNNYYWGREKRSMSNAITVKMTLNASFSGRFYLPGWQVEPMYDGTRYAASAGKWVEVQAQ